MKADFDTIHNHHERAVADAVRAASADYPHMTDSGLLADIACVALNRLPPRYIRHEVDFAFYLSDKERSENERAIREAVNFAFEFVQARVAMRAR
jgi:predicted nucleic acid-binding protein